MKIFLISSIFAALWTSVAPKFYLIDTKDAIQSRSKVHSSRSEGRDSILQLCTILQSGVFRKLRVNVFSNLKVRELLLKIRTLFCVFHLGRSGQSESNSCKCGATRPSKKTRIVGGKDADKNEFPWLVLIWAAGRGLTFSLKPLTSVADLVQFLLDPALQIWY